MKYKLRQINPNKKVSYLFRDYDYALNHGFNLDDYDVVYEGEIEGDYFDTVLENLYTIFNINHPKDFKGRSLSTSDLVELDGRIYYCDDIGWKEWSAVNVFIKN